MPKGGNLQFDSFTGAHYNKHDKVLSTTPLHSNRARGPRRSRRQRERAGRRLVDRRVECERQLPALRVKGTLEDTRLRSRCLAEDCVRTPRLRENRRHPGLRESRRHPGQPLAVLSLAFSSEHVAGNGNEPPRSAQVLRRQGCRAQESSSPHGGAQTRGLKRCSPAISPLSTLCTRTRSSPPSTLHSTSVW